MKLSTKARYGVRAMADLAINYGNAPVSIKSISERQHVSEYYLEQLFSSLRKAELVKSIRGAQGGYILTREPKDITIDEIMAVLEGPIDLADCTLDGSCSSMDCCSTRLLWTRIKKCIDQVTKSTTLQDLVEDYNKLKATSRKEKV